MNRRRKRRTCSHCPGGNYVPGAKARTAKRSRRVSSCLPLVQPQQDMRGSGGAMALQFEQFQITAWATEDLAALCHWVKILSINILILFTRLSGT